MSMKILWAAALIVAGGVAFPVAAMSCGTSIDVINHRNEPVAITLKWFYGERPVRPDAKDFLEVDVQELQANGLANLEVVELPAHASQNLPMRTLCPGAMSNDYLNWRYSLDGSNFVTGQLSMATDPAEVHIR